MSFTEEQILDAKKRLMEKKDSSGKPLMYCALCEFESGDTKMFFSNDLHQLRSEVKSGKYNVVYVKYFKREE